MELRPRRSLFVVHLLGFGVCCSRLGGPIPIGSLALLLALALETYVVNPLYAQISETTFTAQVITMARVFGWRVMHQRPARTKNGWRTAISGDKGFPDLIMLRHTRCIMAELKAAKGKLRPEQEAWLESAKNAEIEAYCWRPADINEIERVLK